MDEGEEWSERENLPQTSREPVPAFPPGHGAVADSTGKKDVLAAVLQRYWCPECWRGEMGSAGRPVSKGLFKSQTMLMVTVTISASLVVHQLELLTHQMVQSDCFHLLDIWCQVFYLLLPQSVVLVPLPLRFNLPMLLFSPCPF